MLEIQNWLINNNFNYNLLYEQLKISANFNEDDDRVILNYNQLESPKLNILVRECRGLILNRKNANLIARSFFKFLNWGEGLKDEMNRFAWDNCRITSKEDGSWLLLYYWNGNWHINTRNSYGQAPVNDSGYTWRQIFEKARVFEYNQLEKDLTYTFELCSPYNQVVRVYPEPTLYLLTVFRGEQELTHEAVDAISEQLNFVKRPHTIQCNDPFEVNAQIAKQASIDKTFEGYVTRDFKNVRFKLKSDEYLLLHRLSNNGNIVSTKNLVDIILKGEEDEMITYFPFIKDRLLELKGKFNKLVDDLDNIFYCHWDQTSRKKFAEEVKKHPLSGVLFSLYGTTHYRSGLIREKISNFKDKVVEYLEKK